MHLNEPLSSFIPYVNGTQCKLNRTTIMSPSMGVTDTGGKRVAVGCQTVPVPACFHCNMKGHNVPNCLNRVVFCYLCGDKGHKSPDCPENKTKVNLVRR